MVYGHLLPILTTAPGTQVAATGQLEVQDDGSLRLWVVKHWRPRDPARMAGGQVDVGPLVAGGVRASDALVTIEGAWTGSSIDGAITRPPAADPVALYPAASDSKLLSDLAPADRDAVMREAEEHAGSLLLSVGASRGRSNVQLLFVSQAFALWYEDSGWDIDVYASIARAE